jgi:hypothetical protein
VKPGVLALRDRRTGSIVSLDEGAAGRWDVTSEPVSPDYEALRTP